MKNLLTLIALFAISLGQIQAQKLRNLGSKVNSVKHEIRPIISKDGGVMFFTVDGGPANRKGQDIWMSVKSVDSGWRKAERLPDYINSQKYNGVYWCSADGRKLLLRGEYDLKKTRGFSFTERVDGRWTTPSPIKIINYSNISRGIFTGATLSSDEKVMILYFCEETNGDNNDLFISFLNDITNEYSSPIKLIISKEEEDEISPYISPDDKTLFFSSDKKGGLGSYDIWMCKRQDSTWMNWSDPMNIGAPFNSKKWDAYFSIGDNGTMGYVATNWVHSLPSGCGGADIASDTLPDYLKPEYPKVIEPIHDTIYIHDTISFTVPCSPFDTMTTEKLREQLTRSRVLFDFGRSDLRSDAYYALDVTIEIMKRNPNIKIEVGGNTDAIGISTRNQKQSDERAQSVKSYLISKGIDPSRIVAKGYSNTRPVGSNKTDEGRQLNRRVDIIVTQE